MDHDRGNWFSRKDGIGRACEEVQDRFDLLARRRRVVLDELVRRHVLQVLENCGYAHTSAAKHPGATNFSGNTFESRAF